MKNKKIYLANYFEFKAGAFDENGNEIGESRFNDEYDIIAILDHFGIEYDYVGIDKYADKLEDEIEDEIYSGCEVCMVPEFTNIIKEKIEGK